MLVVQQKRHSVVPDIAVVQVAVVAVFPHLGHREHLYLLLSLDFVNEIIAVNREEKIQLKIIINMRFIHF